MSFFTVFIIVLRMFASISEILQTDSSRKMVDTASDCVGTDIDLFNEVFMVAVSGKYPLNMRAARVVEQCVFKYKPFAQNRLQEIVEQSVTNKNDGVKRSFLKIIELFLPNNISDDLLGLVIHNCFEKLNGMESVAVKYYSIACLMKILKREPDLAFEFIESLESQLGRNTTAFDRYVKKRLKELEKTYKW